MRFICPLSGVLLADGNRIVEHEGIASLCRGGKSIQIVCYLHGVRCFVNHPAIVTEFTRTVSILAGDGSRKKGG
jgi:hypothetical protein